MLQIVKNIAKIMLSPDWCEIFKKNIIFENRHPTFSTQELVKR